MAKCKADAEGTMLVRILAGIALGGLLYRAADGPEDGPETGTDDSGEGVPRGDVKVSSPVADTPEPESSAGPDQAAAPASARAADPVQAGDPAGGGAEPDPQAERQAVEAGRRARASWREETARMTEAEEGPQEPAPDTDTDPEPAPQQDAEPTSELDPAASPETDSAPQQDPEQHAPEETRPAPGEAGGEDATSTGGQ